MASFHLHGRSVRPSVRRRPSDHEGGLPSQSGPPFAPLPTTNPRERAGAPGARPGVEEGNRQRLTASSAL